jgi:hypothetical protein
MARLKGILKYWVVLKDSSVVQDITGSDSYVWSASYTEEHYVPACLSNSVNSSELESTLLCDILQNSCQHLASAKKLSRFPHMICIILEMTVHRITDNVFYFRIRAKQIEDI